MKASKKLLYVLTAFAVVVFGFLVLSKSNVFACGTYGSECPQGTSLVVDKLIRDPRSKGEVYVDNLTYSDYRFSPGEDIIFKVIVKNTGTSQVQNVKLNDTLPNVVNYVLLSGGVSTTVREVSSDLGYLDPNQTKEWYLRVRVKPAAELPADTVCGDPNAINKVFVTSSNTGQANDTSSFCTQRKVLGAETQPESGAEIYIIAVGLLGITAVGLFGSRKFAV
jgi:uncharacterized repeat protein (TIGR01451 family)